MYRVLDFLGNLSGLLGLVICLVAGLARLTGRSLLLDFEAMTVFVGGIALMVAGCLAKLQTLTSSRS